MEFARFGDYGELGKKRKPPFPKTSTVGTAAMTYIYSLQSSAETE